MKKMISLEITFKVCSFYPFKTENEAANISSEMGVQIGYACNKLFLYILLYISGCQRNRKRSENNCNSNKKSLWMMNKRYK
jgi:hypothetical protein